MRASVAYFPAKVRAGSPGTSLSTVNVTRVTPMSTMTSWNSRLMM